MIEGSTKSTPGYPVRVWIDDTCDACGGKERVGVCFKVGGPVICGRCLEDGDTVLSAGWGEVPPVKAAQVRG